MFLKQQWQSFLVALALLTRLGPSTLVDASLLARSSLYFAPVGAVLGIIYTSIIYVLFILSESFGTVSTWLLAWVYLGLDIWITRALHYDGLADVGDALGSGASGEKFWLIMHDSRLGAFGAIALFFVLSGQLIGLEHLIYEKQWYTLILAPIFGRILCLIFCNLLSPKNPHSLGAKVCTKTNKKLCISFILLSMALILPLGFAHAIMIYAIAAIAFYLLYKTAQKHGGSNGDFMGTTIITGQVIILLLG